MARLHTNKLVKEYSGRRVVDQVSIEVNQGEIVGLLGPNGAGKSTTFNMIFGIVKPTEGEIFFDDVNLSGMPIHQRARHGIGYLAQDTSIFRKLTVEQNIRAIAEVMPGWTSKRKNDKVKTLLDELGLRHLKDSMAYTLSGGERRRTEIARALVPEPKFILLDEPFSGVDPIAVSELQNIIKKLCSNSLGILITDHNARETLSVTHRSYIINEGEVLVSGKSEDVANDPIARKFYLSEDFYIQFDNGDEKSQPGNASDDKFSDESTE